MNKFLNKLDFVPESWEERVSYFCAHLIDVHGIQSTTLKSYVSAIKHILKVKEYEWNDGKVYLDVLVRSCKLINDHQTIQLPIQFKLFELILLETE